METALWNPGNWKTWPKSVPVRLTATSPEQVSSLNRILTVTGNGAEVNGVTISDFHYSSFSGAISLGVGAGTPSAANNTSEKAGIIRNCIVRKVKNTPATSHTCWWDCNAYKSKLSYRSLSY
jgi:hypothetical protein